MKLILKIIPLLIVNISFSSILLLIYLYSNMIIGLIFGLFSILLIIFFTIYAISKKGFARETIAFNIFCFFVFIFQLFFVLVLLTINSSLYFFTEDVTPSTKISFVKEKFEMTRDDILLFSYKERFNLLTEKKMEIYYEGETSPISLNNLKSAEKRILNLLNIKVDKRDKLKIFVYEDSKKFDLISGELTNVCGFYWGHNKTMHFYSFSQKPINECFYHEYTHYILNEYLESLDIEPSSIPLWFLEGVAVYSEYEGFREKEEFQVVPFKKITQTRTWEENREDPKNPYYQSFLAIEFLIDNNGVDSIQQFLLDYSKSADFDGSFKKVFKYDIETFHIKLQADNIDS